MNTDTASPILQPAARLELLELDRLTESPLNTRKHFDPVKLEELKTSIEKSGILTPLLVRPSAKLRNGKGPVYEIAAGHRRFRAGKLAGVATAPCIVRDLDDATFLEILTIENLQREDVHPLEEAQGYRNLLTLDGYDIRKIAARVGKSESYVYDRMKLLQLIAPAQKLFFAQRFTLAHALLLARLSRDDQKRCLAIDDDNSYNGDLGGMWQAEFDAHPPLGLDDPSGIADVAEPESRVKPKSVRELQAWIDDHVRFTTPDPSTPHLFAETATNLEQAKTAQQKVIEISRDHMLKEDAKHPDGKRTYCVTSWARADGQAEEDYLGAAKPSKHCDYAVLGVVVAGRGRGESFLVCIDKKRCTTHWADAIKERNRREREREKESASGKGESTSKKSQQPSWERENEQRRAKEARCKQRWERGGQAVLKAIAPKLKALTMGSTGIAGKWFWERIQDGLYGLDDHGKVAAAMGIPRGTSAADLMRHAIMCHLIDTGEPAEYSDNEKELQADLDGLAIKVNVRQLLDALDVGKKPDTSAIAAKSSKKRSAVKRNAKGGK